MVAVATNKLRLLLNYIKAMFDYGLASVWKPTLLKMLPPPPSTSSRSSAANAAQFVESSVEAEYTTPRSSTSNSPYTPAVAELGNELYQSIPTTSTRSEPYSNAGLAVTYGSLGPDQTLVFGNTLHYVFHALLLVLVAVQLAANRRHKKKCRSKTLSVADTDARLALTHPSQPLQTSTSGSPACLERSLLLDLIAQLKETEEDNTSRQKRLDETLAIMQAMLASMQGGQSAVQAALLTIQGTLSTVQGAMLTAQETRSSLQGALSTIQVTLSMMQGAQSSVQEALVMVSDHLANRFPYPPVDLVNNSTVSSVAAPRAVSVSGMATSTSPLPPNIASSVMTALPPVTLGRATENAKDSVQLAKQLVQQKANVIAPGTTTTLPTTVKQTRELFVVEDSPDVLPASLVEEFAEENSRPAEGFVDARKAQFESMVAGST